MSVYEGNHFDKYRSSNPIHRFLLSRFLGQVAAFYSASQPSSVLEVGCGPGDLAGELRERVVDWGQYLGTDLSANQIAIAEDRYPTLSFRQANAVELPFSDNSFDLVIACEVLEHIESPELALREISRVSKRWMLVSVPWEPAWRIVNCLRGKYLLRLGNTPGHVNHFSRRKIRKLLETEGTVRRIATPFPWTVLLVELNRPQDSIPI